MCLKEQVISMQPRYLSLKSFLPWKQVSHPIDWTAQFGRAAPLEVEIGFGNGAFLVRQAQMYPERNFIGLELEWASVQRALRRIAQANVHNVRLLQVDARTAFERFFLPQSLTYVYSLFPCPWPKKRHAKHRLFSHPFLQLLNSRLVPEGEVQIVTDHYPYLQWVLEQVSDTGFAVHWKQIPPRFDTKYERKWYEQGQEQFYELRLHKITHLDIPVKEEIRVETYWVECFDPDRFQPVNERQAATVEFKEFLYDPKRLKGMVRVVVAEENLVQSFWIEIVQREGRWQIRPARGCDVVPTLGVQRALDLVRDAALRPCASE
ncbi:MAG: tRNA (guanosine(46)-N7)-methyltransferase TrmB [Nitrospinota bacterium]|nr:MAG: tRNA (guanosine(46)-N7)-methyltransferase TrmB [Nitrospinota bacterium]